MKAAIIHKLTLFVEWPPEEVEPGPPLAGPGAAVTPRARELAICLVEGGAVGEKLEGLARRKEQVRGKKIVIRRVLRLDELERCHVVWIGPGEGARLEAILAHTRGLPILTVADTPGFVERGVLVNLRREGDRVAFEVNRAEEKRSGLRFGARLLRLATIHPPEKR